MHHIRHRKSPHVPAPHQRSHLTPSESPHKISHPTRMRHRHIKSPHVTAPQQMSHQMRHITEVKTVTSHTMHTRTKRVTPQKCVNLNESPNASYDISPNSHTPPMVHTRMARVTPHNCVTSNESPNASYPISQIGHFIHDTYMSESCRRRPTVCRDDTHVCETLRIPWDTQSHGTVWHCVSGRHTCVCDTVSPMRHTVSCECVTPCVGTTHMCVKHCEFYETHSLMGLCDTVCRDTLCVPAHSVCWDSSQHTRSWYRIYMNVHAWVPTHVNMSPNTRKHESCNTNTHADTSQKFHLDIHMSHGTHTWVMAHIRRRTHIRMRHTI